MTSVSRKNIIISSKGILAFFMKRRKEDHRENIIDIYNNAIKDAVDFIESMSRSNPQYKLGFLALIEEMKCLPLDLGEDV